MTKKIVASAVISYFAISLLNPPDIVAQTILGIAGALLCAVPLAILARFGFMKESSGSVHTLVCIVVCMIAVLSVQCYMLRQRVQGLQSPLQTPQSYSVKSGDLSPSALREPHIDSPIR